jgi:transposase
MRQRIAELEAKLARVTAERDKLRRAYELAKEQLELLRRRIYVAKAERIDVQQLELEFAVRKAELEKLATQLEEPAANEPAGQDDVPAAKTKPKGRRNLAAVPMTEERVEILDPTLEGKAERIGFEESYRLAYRRGGPVRVVLARATYKTTHDDGTVSMATAEKPKELFRRGLLAPSLVAHILIAKYRFGIPFVRLSKMLSCEGVDLDDGTMCRYAEDAGATLGPIVEACAAEARAKAFCLATDATGVAIQPTPLPTGARQPCAKGHFFVVLADRDHVFFEYKRKHNSDAVCEMFRGFGGYILADAHCIYDALFRGDARVSPDDKPPEEVACWSHCRRHFWEAAIATKDPLAREGLMRIRALFQLEEGWASLAPQQRHHRRQLAARRLVDEFFVWAEEQFARVRQARGLLAAAFGYAVRQKDALCRFLDDGRLPMTSRVGGRRGGVQAALGCVRRFQLRARVGSAIAPSPAPATSNRTGGFPASGSPRGCHHVGVMRPSRSAPLSRGGSGPGSHRRDPRCRTPSRYSTSTNQSPFASASSPQTA